MVGGTLNSPATTGEISSLKRGENPTGGPRPTLPTPASGPPKQKKNTPDPGAQAGAPSRALYIARSPPVAFACDAAFAAVVLMHDYALLTTAGLESVALDALASECFKRS